MSRTIYTDGGANPNPGPGGWGAIIVDDASGGRREISGGEGDTTNNRMELTAAICALEAVPEDSVVALYTDSRYLRSGITEWLPRWRALGFKRRAGELKNVDLWKRLDAANARRTVRWNWVKGHAGNELNERADELATAEIEKLRASSSSPEPVAVVGAAEGFIRVRSVRGRGVWVVSISDGDQEVFSDGRAEGTTANRLELEAVLHVFAQTDPRRPLILWTASDYVRRGATEWITAWQRSRWQSASGEPVKNADLWRTLARLVADRTVHWRSLSKDDALSKELVRRAKETLFTR